MPEQASQYFFANGNEQRGPYSLAELAGLGLRPDTLVWREGLSEWQRADRLPELAGSFAPTPPTVARASNMPPMPIAPLNYAGQSFAPTDGMAVASMVLGIVSIPGLCVYGLGIIPAMLAIIFGFIAKSRIKKSLTTGESMAKAGIVMGFITIGLLVVLIIIAIVAAVSLH